MVKEEQAKEASSTFPAIVAKVVSEYTIVINRGARDGVKVGQRLQIYSVSDEEIPDPETGEALEHLELIKGTGTVTHVQETMATLKSDQYEQVGRRTVTRKGGILTFGGDLQETFEPSRELVAFEDPSVGDKARPI